MDSNPPSRILIVRLSALGDVLLTLPVLGMIRECYPNATIGWLVEADAAHLLQGNPMINYIHISHRKQWLNALRDPLAWPGVFRQVLSFLAEIRRHNYQVGLDFQGLMKSAVTLFLTGIPRRIGFSGAREKAPYFYTETITLTEAEYFDPKVSLSNHQAKLANAIGCFTEASSIPLPLINRDVRHRVTQLLKVLPTQFVVFAPATQWASKHWPKEHWTQLLQAVMEETNLGVALVGGPADVDSSREIITQLPENARKGRILDLTGQTSLIELQAVFEKATAVVGPDSAPLHMAGAVGKSSLIGLYGPTAYRRTPPPGTSERVLLSTEDEMECQPCHEKTCPLGTGACMTRITPQRVLEALQNTI